MFSLFPVFHYVKFSFVKLCWPKEVGYAQMNVFFLRSIQCKTLAPFQTINSRERQARLLHNPNRIIYARATCRQCNGVKTSTNTEWCTHSIYFAGVFESTLHEANSKDEKMVSTIYTCVFVRNRNACVLALEPRKSRVLLPTWKWNMVPIFLPWKV